MQSQVMVILNDGEKVLFNVNSHAEFEDVVRELESWWGSWLRIGKDAVLRKKCVESMYFLEEGYVNGNS